MWQKLEAQLVALQQRHEKEMQKMQEQVAGLATVIKLGGQKQSEKEEHANGEQARASQVEKDLLACVERMRLQQQEEKKSTIALFQRHCQETMASQERLADELHREIAELRKREGETLEFKQSVLLLSGKVDQLNLNNVLLGNIPGQFTSLKTIGAPDDHHLHYTRAARQTRNAGAARHGVPQLALNINNNNKSNKPRTIPLPALAVSRVQSTKQTTATNFSNSSDEPVGVSITIGADFDRVQKHEKRFSDDLMSACAWCLQASQDRFVYHHIERGSVIAKFNIVPDPSGMDPRPCRRLAEELAAQVAHQHSPIRKAPVTKPSTKVVIHLPITHDAYLQPLVQLQRLDEVEVDNFEVDHLDESPREDFSNPEPEPPRDYRIPEEEAWTEKQKEDELAAMKRGLEEMDAVVSNLASSVPLGATLLDATSMSVLPESPSEDEGSERSQHLAMDRMSDAYPPAKSPVRSIASTPRKSVMDLSLEQPPAQGALRLSKEPYIISKEPDTNKYSRIRHGIRTSSTSKDSEYLNAGKLSQQLTQQHTQQHTQRVRTTSTSKATEYRRLPHASALELESVLSRLEHHVPPTVPHSPKSLAHVTQGRGGGSRHDTSCHEPSWLDDSRNSSRSYAPTATEFTSSVVVAASPHPGMLHHHISEKGTLTPGSETSMNMSRRSVSPAEAKKWRVLPQWSEGDNDSFLNGKKPRSQVILGTPRLQVGALPLSARETREPQTLAANPTVPPPLSDRNVKHTNNALAGASSQVSQRGNSPNLRRRQYARSDSSSDDETPAGMLARAAATAGTRSTLLSSARSETHDKMGDEKRNAAKTILKDSDSDEEIRVRATDLPVRRLVNSRFQK